MDTRQGRTLGGNGGASDNGKVSSGIHSAKTRTHGLLPRELADRRVVKSTPNTRAFCVSLIEKG